MSKDEMTAMLGQSKDIVLASGSKTRADLLRDAGLKIDIVPANVDEDAVKDSLRAEGATADRVAEALSDLKALKISQRFPQALVIGADQTLDCNGVWFDKPIDMDHLHGHIQALSGSRHSLYAGVSVMQGGQRLWGMVEPAHMTMRSMTPDFIARYCQAVGEDALGSVGGYRLEG
ncbi:MAG: Maf family protein, partial [Alphaproteobacteria bacterium]|nr:Maf family protein [Alphaproteobacteria bacterium]